MGFAGVARDIAILVASRTRRAENNMIKYYVNIR